MSTDTSTPTTRAVEAAKTMMASINEMAFDRAAFAETVANDHRTLQQSAAGVLLTVILRLAENDIDPRNAQAVRACEIVSDALRAADEVFIDRNNVVRFSFI